MAAPSSSKRRHTPQHPCLVCGGDDRDPRGQGKRCFGFLSGDGEWERCTREEFAGNAPFDEESRAWVHKLHGPCKCGVTHNPDQNANQTKSSQKQQWHGRLIATYDYHDKDGKLLFSVRRYEPKHFVQGHFNQSGQWVWNLQGVPLVLYRLPELLKSGNDQVWIVEGEKDVDNLRARGLTATCNPMGAGKWRQEYGEWLRGRDVIVIPDNDDKHTVPPFAGQRHAQDVARKLAGVAASIKVLVLPANKGKDVTDYLKAGGTVGELRDLAQKTAEWKPETKQKEEAQQEKKNPLNYRELYEALSFVNAAELDKKTFPAFRSPLPGLITEGFTILAAGTKNGKSCWMMQAAKAISMNGKAFSFLDTDPEPCEVLYIYLEENEQGIQEHQRLMRETGDTSGLPTNLIYTTEWPRLDMGAIECLEYWLDDHPLTSLIVIDMLVSIWPQSRRGSSSYVEEYAVSKRLADLANRRHVAIVGLVHAGKFQHEDAIQDINLTTGFAGGAHHILTIRKQGEQYVLFSKGRRLKLQELAMRFDDTHRTWKILGKASEVAATEERQQILDLLCDGKKARTPLTEKDIAALLSKEQSAIHYLLWKMEQEKNIKVAGKEGRANLYTCAHDHRIPNSPNGPNDSQQDQSPPDEGTVGADDSSPNGPNGWENNQPDQDEPLGPLGHEEETPTDTNPDTESSENEPLGPLGPLGGDDEDFDALTDTGKQRIIDFQEELKKRQHTFSETPLEASALNLIDDETRTFLEGWLPYAILEKPFEWLRGYVARIGYQVLHFNGVDWGGSLKAWEREFTNRMDHITAKHMTAHYQALEQGG